MDCLFKAFYIFYLFIDSPGCASVKSPYKLDQSNISQGMVNKMKLFFAYRLRRLVGTLLTSK